MQLGLRQPPLQQQKSDRNRDPGVIAALLLSDRSAGSKAPEEYLPLDENRKLALTPEEDRADIKLDRCGCKRCELCRASDDLSCGETSEER